MLGYLERNSYSLVLVAIGYQYRIYIRSIISLQMRWIIDITQYAKVVEYNYNRISRDF